MSAVKIGLVLCLGVFVYAEEKKWVWDDNSRSGKSNKLRDEKPSARYEIFEPEDYDGFEGGGGFGGGGGFNRPIRPGFNGPRPFPNQGPGPIYGGSLGHIGGDKFGQRPPYGGYGPGGRPGPGGIIGGPNYRPYPEIDGRPPFKKFDTCSCSERFNCKSPGISYGHCDTGKSYCCYNKHGGFDIEPPPSRPIHSPENGILVGPGAHGGSYGRPGYDQRPEFDGRPDYDRPPIREPLGPGGPGFLGQRPLGGRPILVGPGGPYDRPYGRPRPFGLLGRSAGDKEKVEK